MMVQNHAGHVGITDAWEVDIFASDVAYGIGPTVKTSDVVAWLTSINVLKMTDLYQKLGMLDEWDLCSLISGSTPILKCQKPVRDNAKAWAIQNYKPVPSGFNLCPTCQQRGIECGNVPPDSKCPNETKCGACGANLTCVDGKCVAPPCVPQTCAQAGAECGSVPDGCGGVINCGKCPSGKTCGAGGPNKCGTDPNAPISQHSRTHTFDPVQKGKKKTKPQDSKKRFDWSTGNQRQKTEEPEESSGQQVVLPWVPDPGTKWVGAGGFQLKAFEDCLAAMDTTMPESDKMSACSLLLDPETSYEDLTGFGATLEQNKFPIAAKMFKDAAALKKPAEENPPPPPPSTSNTLAWVLGGLGAVAAVGAVAYFATRKPGRASSNPAKMSGYKNMPAAMRHAASLARELGVDHYLAVRSDGFHIETEPPRNAWDDEYVQFKPNGETVHWLLGKQGWKIRGAWEAPFG